MTPQLTGSIEAIMQNICSQLISFQQQIAEREENKGIPTAQEINMQCKLINCIDKLRRYHSVLAKAARAAEPARAEHSIAANTATQATGGNTNNGSFDVTEDDFAVYGSLMGDFGHLKEHTTIRFKGGYVTVKWLEYNLYQYCLPPAERRFILSESQVASEVDYNDLQQKITEYNRRQDSVAA